jgi:hypothetical protein
MTCPIYFFDTLFREKAPIIKITLKQFWDYVYTASILKKCAIRLGELLHLQNILLLISCNILLLALDHCRDGGAGRRGVGRPTTANPLAANNRTSSHGSHLTFHPPHRRLHAILGGEKLLYTVPKAHEEVRNIWTYGLGAKPYITNYF